LKYVRSKSVATVLPADVDPELVQWINVLRKHGPPESAKMLESQAKETASDYNISSFMTSWHWRNGVHEAARAQHPYTNSPRTSFVSGCRIYSN
ncbi:hypothetical protein JG688_00013463, partial [Phytophthora aleatoria]